MSNNLKPIGKWFHGDLVSNGELTTEELNEYIDRFDNETAESINEGDVTYNYSYYFEQLENFAELNPTFQYNGLLTEERSKLLSFFYNLIERRNKIRKNHGYKNI